MTKGTNLVWKNNPRWPTGNVTETIKVQAVGSSLPPGAAAPRPRRCLPGPIGIAVGAFHAGCVSLAGWLAGMPRQAGGRLFARNDEEAGWRGWQPTQLHRGLARSYRDERFGILHLIRGIDSGTQALDGCPLDRDR